jgi:ubiquinone/menaquinone biosynthesis C-methylase UbiE
MDTGKSFPQASWSDRISKAGRYLRYGDVRGLFSEIRQFGSWKRFMRNRDKMITDGARGNGCSVSGSVAETNRAIEGEFWDRFDAELGRKISWASRSEFGLWALQKMSNGCYQDIVDIVVDMMQVPRAQPLLGLVLGCGDMSAEHHMFVNPKLPFAEVDAYDVSPKSIEKARQLTDEKELKVNYGVADVNTIELPADRYALIVVFHSFHHFEQVQHVAQQINRALLPGGVFYTFDYVGPQKLQFTERQRLYAQSILQLLPRAYRREMDRTVRERVLHVPPDMLSPDEAICSDQILPAMAKSLNIVWQYNWGGLLYPLLEGIAFNFTDSSEDLSLLRFLFGLDYALCHSGEIEPNFTITLATKR